MAQRRQRRPNRHTRPSPLPSRRDSPNAAMSGRAATAVRSDGASARDLVGRGLYHPFPSLRPARGEEAHGIASFGLIAPALSRFEQLELPDGRPTGPGGSVGQQSVDHLGRGDRRRSLFDHLLFVHLAPISPLAPSTDLTVPYGTCQLQLPAPPTIVCSSW